MAKQKQDDQLEHTYCSYVRIWDVALKTCQRRLMIGRRGERVSGISVLVARHDDDDNDIYICVYVCVYVCVCVCVCKARCRNYTDKLALLTKYSVCPCGVMVKATDCGIVVSEFEFQSHYYVPFRTNTLGKCMNLLILPAMG